MPAKKVAKVEYNNPVVEVTKRPFVATNDIQYKAMMDLMWNALKKDKTGGFRFCCDCPFGSETRAGGKLHKVCQNVYISKQLLSIGSRLNTVNSSKCSVFNFFSFSRKQIEFYLFKKNLVLKII